MPGDIFALRNAGNTCTHAEGSIKDDINMIIKVIIIDTIKWCLSFSHLIHLFYISICHNMHMYV